MLDHKAEGIKSLDEAKADIETFLKREKAEKALLASATQAVGELSANPNKPRSDLAFGAEQIFTFADNQDATLINGIFSIAKPENGATYKIVRNGKGDVIIAALDKVEQGELTEQELTQFGAQLLKAHQLELRAQLMQALREKAQIEINETFIKQEEEN